MAAGYAAVDVSVSSKKAGKNPLDFLGDQLKELPQDIVNVAGPLIDNAMKNVNVNDIMQFANSSAASAIMNAVTSDSFNNIKGLFKDPGLQKSGDLAGN